ncbi:hypothetical protein EB118_14000 [bacterium]|nr:hypothetical protein [bacterium]
MRNFLGRDGFIWWFGIVEDANDPLKLGRCRVRIFGYNPPISDNAVVTEDLPWATAIHSPNTWGVYNTPEIGDWVLGFFLDAMNAQEPAIIGIIPGIPKKSNQYFGKEPRVFKDTKLPVRSFSSIVNFVESLDLNWNLANTIIWESKSDNKSKTKHGNFLMFYDQENNEQVILASSNNHIIRMSDKENDKFISIISTANNVFKIDDNNNAISLLHNKGSYININNIGITLSTNTAANVIVSNEKISLYSKTGHTIDLDETSNKLTIKHKGGTQIVIDSTGKIMMTAIDDIEINSKDIVINSDNFTINADNVDINSTGTLDLSGASGSITATGGFNVHASGVLDLQGSTINLN